MEFQSELLVILQDAETKNVWGRIYADFRFNPSINTEQQPFKFQIPVDAYDISKSPIYSDDITINGIIKTSFIECMGDDDFMYALDWQHTCFRYNPRIDTYIEYPVFMKDERHSGG